MGENSDEWPVIRGEEESDPGPNSDESPAPPAVVGPALAAAPVCRGRPQTKTRPNPLEFDGRGRHPNPPLLVNDSLSLECPHCGEPFTIALDVSEGSAEFVVDCEVCCRPMAVAVRIGDDGEIASLDVTES